MPRKVEPLVAVFSAIDQISEPIKGIQKEIDSLGQTLKNTDKGAFKEFSASLKESKKYLNDFKKNVGDVTKAVGVALAGATTGFVAFSTTSVKQFADYAGEIDDVTQRLNVNATALQEWRYAAIRTGSSSQAMDTALMKLGKTMQDVNAGGNKSAKELFDKLGISITDANGNLRATTDVMAELAEGFQKNENGALRTSMAMTLLGRSGTELIPLLAGGAEGVKSFVDEARDLGLILSDTEVAQAAELGDEMDKMGLSFQMVATKIGAALAPAAKLFSSSMAQIFATITKNDALLNRITKTAETFINQLVAIDWVKFINSFLDFGASVIDVVNAVGGLKNVLIGVGSYFAISKFIMPLAQAFMVLSSAMQLVGVGKGLIALKLLTAPLQSLIATVGVLSKAIFAVAGGAFKSLIVGLKGIGVAVKMLIGSTGIGLIVLALGAIGTWIYSNWDVVVDWFKRNQEAFQPFINAFNVVVEYFKNFFSQMKEIVTSENPLKTFVEITIENFKNLMSFIDKLFGNIFSETWNKFIAFFKNFSPIENFTNFFKDSISQAIKFVMGLFDAFYKKVADIFSFVSDIKDSVLGFFSDSLGSVKDFFTGGNHQPQANLNTFQAQSPNTYAPQEINEVAYQNQQISRMKGQLDVNIRAEKGLQASTVRTASSDYLTINSNTGVLR